jgi:serine/threonine protein kinase
MQLFTEQINNWEDWGNVFQSIPAFTPLIEYIFKKENLPAAKIENLMPGTNAVFKVGSYVVKIFAPPGLLEDEDFGTNVDVELFGIKWANSQGVPSPKLIADGAVEDKYYFRYMIMEHINGKMLDEIEDSLSYEDKIIIGQKLRKIFDSLNMPCENFTPIDVMQYARDNKAWEAEGFPESFQKERLAYLDGLRMSDYEKVYCHGDTHCQNILIDDDLNVYLIDFADAMYAPVGYEQSYVVSALLCFEKPYMTGYFGGD